MQERLQKIIARAGIASRRHAEQLILSGQVRVNGRVVTELGMKADAATDRIEAAGRKEVIGRPILYKTSKEFLMRFGLSDLEELPSLKEFEALAREALGSDEGLTPPAEVASEEKPSETAEHAQMEAREELLEETAANNEGMPEPEGDKKDSQKAAAAGE